MADDESFTLGTDRACMYISPTVTEYNGSAAAGYFVLNGRSFMNLVDM